MSNLQLAFILCHECYENLRLNETDTIAIIRTSHKSSFYCEHAEKPNDWHCGSTEPILMYVSRYPS